MCSRRIFVTYSEENVAASVVGQCRDRPEPGTRVPESKTRLAFGLLSLACSQKPRAPCTLLEHAAERRLRERAGHFCFCNADRDRTVGRRASSCHERVQEFIRSLRDSGGVAVAARRNSRNPTTVHSPAGSVEEELDVSVLHVASEHCLDEGNFLVRNGPLSHAEPRFCQRLEANITVRRSAVYRFSGWNAPSVRMGLVRSRRGQRRWRCNSGSVVGPLGAR